MCIVLGAFRPPYRLLVAGKKPVAGALFSTFSTLPRGFRVSLDVLLKTSEIALPNEVIIIETFRTDGNPYPMIKTAKARRQLISDDRNLRLQNQP